MKLFIFILLVFFSLSSFCQKDRYRFAETYVGFETELVTEHNSFIYQKDGISHTEKLPSQITPRILIGGTHFWRHADFYISIPLTNIQFGGSKNISLTNDVYTGFRYLPFTLEDKTVRPYVGVGFNSKGLKLKNGPYYTNWQWFYEGGFNYRKNNKIFGFEMRYIPKSDFYNAYSRTKFQNTKTNPFSFSLSYKVAFDATAGYSSEGAKKYMKKIYNDAEKAGALSAFSFGIGLNAIIPLGKTELASQKAFFNDEIEGALTYDVGIGYYSNPLDATVRVSYRPIKQEETAFDYTYRLNNHSVAFEVFKFIGDYHGFVPFVGPYISLNRYHLEEIDLGKTTKDMTTNKLGYGLVFGWDIRQSRVDYITLRTNLRYTPEMNYKAGASKFTSKQIEFNFIQLVYYPERHKIYKQKK